MRITLDIDTGAGNHPTISQIGEVRPNYTTLWAAIGFDISFYADRVAQDVSRDLDNYVEAMHDSPALYSGYPEPVRRDYEQALAVLIKLRNECKLHPLCQIVVPIPPLAI
jgi:hypothetical protein